MTALTQWLLDRGLAANPTSGLLLALAFNTLEQPENEWRLARSGHAMNGTRYWEVAENIIQLHGCLR